MTEYHLSGSISRNQDDWSPAYEQYVTAVVDLNVEVARAVEANCDIDNEIVCAHTRAGFALMELPASDMLQAAQKIRVAGNLQILDRDREHPKLVQGLISDLLTLARPDVEANPLLLPPSAL